MEIDILKLGAIITALSVIFGVIIGGYKLYDRLLDRMDEIEKRMNAQEKELERMKKEDTLVIFALRACLDGLKQQGCNGKVTEAFDMLDKHINKAAHDQDI